MSFHSGPRRGRGFDRKTMQLCKHVERELAQVLSGECDDDVLRELMVVDVQPLDGAAQLLVVVQPYDLERPPDRVLILKKLHAVKGKLRYAIGETISRRKVPDLAFKIAGPSYGLDEQLALDAAAQATLAARTSSNPSGEAATDEAEADDANAEGEEETIVDAIEDHA